MYTSTVENFVENKFAESRARVRLWGNWPTCCFRYSAEVAPSISKATNQVSLILHYEVGIVWPNHHFIFFPKMNPLRHFLNDLMNTLKHIHTTNSARDLG
jgi:hypothetical protein